VPACHGLQEENTSDESYGLVKLLLFK